MQDLLGKVYLINNNNEKKTADFVKCLFFFKYALPVSKLHVTESTIMSNVSYRKNVDGEACHVRWNAPAICWPSCENKNSWILSLQFDSLKSRKGLQNPAL